MLPTTLASLKRQLESEIYLNNDEKKSLQILKVLDSDKEFQKILTDSEVLTKSFSVAPQVCPSCGKKI